MRATRILGLGLLLWLGAAGVALGAGEGLTGPVVCLQLVPDNGTAPIIYAMVWTNVNEAFNSAIGRSAGGLAVRILTGASVQLDRTIDVSLQGSEILSPPLTPQSVLVLSNTHMKLVRATLTGPFLSFQQEITESGAITTSVTSGTVGPVNCALVPLS
jgi:hypothetical protein